MKSGIFPIPPGLPDLAVDGGSLLRIVHRPQQTAFLEGEQHVLRILRDQAPQDGQSFAVAMLTAQEQEQDDLGVYIVLATTVSDLVEVLDAFFLAAAQPHQRYRYLDSPRQA